MPSVRKQLSDNEENADLPSSGRHNDTDPTNEDFRTLFNTNCKESSEITAETVRMIKCENTSQFPSELNDIKVDLNSQIREAIRRAIT